MDIHSLIDSSNLFLLIGELRPLIFRVIIESVCKLHFMMVCVLSYAFYFTKVQLHLFLSRISWLCLLFSILSIAYRTLFTLLCCLIWIALALWIMKSFALSFNYARQFCRLHQYRLTVVVILNLWYIFQDSSGFQIFQ